MRYRYICAMVLCLVIAGQGTVLADDTPGEEKAGVEKKQLYEKYEKEYLKSRKLVRMRELFLGERYKSLESMVQDYRKDYPGDHSKEIYFYQAVIYENAGDYRKAAETYLEALRISPDYSRAHNNLANLYCRLHQYHFAETHYRNALDVNPYNPFINFNLGSLYYDTGSFEKAAEYLDRAITYKENFAEAYHKRGLVHFKMQQYSHAIRNFKKAKEFGRESHTTYYYIGMAHYHVEQGSLAIVNLERALQKKKDFYEAAVALGDIHKYYGEFKQALQAYGKAIDIKDDSREVKLKMIQCYNELHYYNSAIKMTRELLSKEPGNKKLKTMLNRLNSRYLKENLQEPYDYMSY